MSSVAPMNAGFKQVAAGGYLTVVSTLERTNMYVKPVTTGSGGSATVAAPVPFAAGVYSALSVSPGSALKDMGATQVSSSRVFRKLKAQAINNGSNFGDVATSDNNFGTFYLEVAGDGGDLPNVNKSIVARA